MIETNRALPGGLKVAALYFLVIGLFGILWPFVGFGPSYSQFRDRSAAYKLGASFSQSLISIAYMVAGGSIFARQSWAPGMAYLILAIATLYSANELAWGFTGGPPSRMALASAFVVASAWNALWAFVVYRSGVP